MQSTINSGTACTRHVDHAAVQNTQQQEFCSLCLCTVATFLGDLGLNFNLWPYIFVPLICSHPLLSSEVMLHQYMLHQRQTQTSLSPPRVPWSGSAMRAVEAFFPARATACNVNKTASVNLEWGWRLCSKPLWCSQSSTEESNTQAWEMATVLNNKETLIHLRPEMIGVLENTFFF